MISQLTESTIKFVKDKKIKITGKNPIRENLSELTKRCSFGKTNEKYKKAEGMIAEKAKLILTQKSLNKFSLIR
jgi:hypothetical protein